MASSPKRPPPKCLVLGGSGFMGRHLCDALLKRSCAVRVFERLTPHPIPVDRARASIEWVYGDFVNRSDVTAAVSGCDVIFHLISTTLPKNSNENPLYDVETNLSGTLNVLEAARTTGASRIIFASSGGTVYGVPIQIPIPETHPTNPICSYGIVKLTIEKYIQLYHTLHGLNYLILRIANPFGEGQRPDVAQGAVAVFLHRALKDRPIEIWGDGTVVRDYLYISDVIDAFMRALDYDGNSRIMNIGATRGHSLNDLMRAMEDVLGRPLERTHLPARPFDVPVNVLDSTLAKELLGWEPRVPLRDGLRRTLDWLKDFASTDGDAP
jgi:UDP-glucose 4-epimerase